MTCLQNARRTTYHVNFDLQPIGVLLKKVILEVPNALQQRNGSADAASGYGG